MTSIPNSILNREIMRQQAREAAERAIMRQKKRKDAERAVYRRQLHSNEIMNSFSPTDEEIEEIAGMEEIERSNRRIPHYLPDEGQRPYRRLRFPVDRIPSAGPEEGLDYGRPYRSLERRTYPEYRTMEYRYGRDDMIPHRLDDGVYRPNDPRYRDVRLTPMGGFGYDDVEF